MRTFSLPCALLLVAVGGTRGRATPDRPPPQVAMLRAGEVDSRRAAAAEFRRSPRDVQRAALPAMIDALKDEKDGQVRLAVLDTLTVMGPDAASAVPALVQTLRTDNGGPDPEEAHQDYRSALALAAVGKPAVEGLVGLLKERKARVRAEVVMALGRIGPEAGAAVLDLIPLLGDKDDRIRREASLALGRIGPAAVGPLIAAIGGPDVVVRARAVEGLGQVPAPDGDVHRAVLGRTRDDVPEVRAAALRSLSKFKLPDETLLPILGENLRHGDESVRLAVVNLLVGRRALLPRMAPELESLLTAEDDGVAHHAAFLLRKIGPDAAPRLLKALPHPKSRIDPIAEALAQIGRPAVAMLTEALRSPEPRVRRGAALALAQIRPEVPGAVQTLMAGLDDPDLEVRASILAAIGVLGPRAKDAVPAVRGMLRDKSPEIRLEVVAILAQAAPRDDRLIDDLAALIDDPDARVQRRAIDVLRSVGPPGRKSLSAVVGKLDSKDPEVRLSAAEFVGSHGQAAVEAVPALATLLDDPSPKLRTVAAQILGRLGKAAQPSFDRLASLIGDGRVEVREAAALALGSLELDAEVVRPHLARALRDDNAEVRRAASKAIGRLGPQGAILVPDIIALAAKRDNLKSVERMLRPFERTGPDPRSVPELVKLLGHDAEAVRLLAIRFLKLAGPRADGAISALERLRDDPSVEVRKQAAEAIDHIKGRPASSESNEAAIRVEARARAG